MMENMWDTSMQKLLKMIITTKDTFTPQERGGKRRRIITMYPQDQFGPGITHLGKSYRIITLYSQDLGPRGRKRHRIIRVYPQDLGPPGGKRHRIIKWARYLRGEWIIKITRHTTGARGYKFDLF